MRRTLKKAAIGSERIDSFSPNTELGKLRLAGSIKSAKVTKTLFKKINETVKITQSKKKAVGKKKKKKAKQPTFLVWG